VRSYIGSPEPWRVSLHLVLVIIIHIRVVFQLVTRFQPPCVRVTIVFHSGNTNRRYAACSAVRTHRTQPFSSTLGNNGCEKTEISSLLSSTGCELGCSMACSIESVVSVSDLQADPAATARLETRSVRLSQVRGGGA
jgi:hypothetical protein